MEDYLTSCDEWLTGIVDLDDQHAGLARCISEIENSCTGSNHSQTGDLSNKQLLPTLLDRLYRATKEHFKSEEAAMLEAGYPNYATHTREHILMIAELRLIIKEHESGKNTVDAEMARGIKVWYIAHIKLSDCKFSAFISTRQPALQ